MKKILLFLSFLLMSIGVFGETISITQSDVNANGSGKTSYSNDYNINGWTGRYCVSLANSVYSLQLGYTSTSSQNRYNSHITTPAMSGGATSITISTKSHNGGNTSSGRKFYLCKSDNLGYVNDSHLPAAGTYGSGAISSDNGSVTITIIGNPTQFHIYPNGTAYISSITVTYSTDSKKDTVIWIANNDTIYKEYPSHNTIVDSIPEIDINDYCDDIFFGWTNSEYENLTPPDVLFTTSKPTITQDTTFYAVFGSTPTYKNTNISEIDSGDVVIIIGEKGGNYYAMTNDNGTSNPPVTSEIDVVDDLIFSASANILWDFSVVNKNEYTFYKYNDNTKWLYCTNTNNGVRVGTNNNKTFTIDKGYLNHSSTSRYVGIYNSQDWRCYTTINDNIKNEYFYFFKQISGENDYHTETTCIREFNDSLENGLWKTKTNWLNHKLPTIKYTAQINKPVTVNSEHAVAKNIVINQNDGTGKITIQPNKGLEVDSTIVVYKNNSYHPTTPNDLILESSDAGNASLIFNNKNNNQATVCLYSKSYIDRDKNEWHWQYMGTAMTSLDALYNYYGSWVYRWDGEQQTWIAVPNGGTMNAWTGYCITQETNGWYATTGTLVKTDELDTILTVPARGDMVFANSWTAPIHISKLVESGFKMTPMNVYFFNTGYAPQSEGGSSEYTGEGEEAGTHIVIPVHAAPYLKNTLIAPQQGFFVSNAGGANDGSIHLNYKVLVRDSDSIVAGSMRAPKRKLGSVGKPDVMKIYANGSLYRDNVVILEREDFSTGFDNGWDGNKSSFGVNAPSIYVINSDDTYDAVSSIPDYEGTVLGFKSGSDSIYTITFEYDGDNEWYLNDLVVLTSTLIENNSKYTFTHDSENDVRFIISATPYADIATDIGKTNDDKSNVHKYLHNGSLYIIKNNRIFNAIGNLIQ